MDTENMNAKNKTGSSGRPPTPESILSSVFGYSAFRGDQKIEARPAAEVATVLAARDRSAAGPTAPARGLTLLEVRY